MEALSMEYVKENLVHSFELVQYFEPTWDTEKSTDYLWENTAFPFDLKTTILQLNEQFSDKIK